MISSGIIEITKNLETVQTEYTKFLTDLHDKESEMSKEIKSIQQAKPGHHSEIKTNKMVRAIQAKYSDRIRRLNVAKNSLLKQRAQLKRDKKVRFFPNKKKCFLVFVLFIVVHVKI